MDLESKDLGNSTTIFAAATVDTPTATCRLLRQRPNGRSTQPAATIQKDGAVPPRRAVDQATQHTNDMLDWPLSNCLPTATFPSLLVHVIETALVIPAAVGEEL